MGLGGVIYIPSFTKNGSGIQGILRVLPKKLSDRNIGITDGRQGHASAI
jgi:hypothetical protein